jgi:hypothetical protein
LVQIRTFIVDHDLDKLGIVATLVREHWGDRPPAHTLVGVAALALPEMLFEVDAVATRPAPYVGPRTLAQRGLTLNRTIGTIPVWHRDWSPTQS